MIVCRLWSILPAQNAVDGQYLVRVDVDANDGMGNIVTTADPRRAARFRTAIDVLALRQRISTVRPHRDDGQPNRPLSAFDLEVITLADELSSSAHASPT